MAWKYVTFLIACYTIAMASWFTITQYERGTLDAVSFLFVWGLAILWLLVSIVLQIADLPRKRNRRRR
jgi:hypothetical protein